MSDTKQKKTIRSLIGAGSEIAGGAIGGAIGFFAGGPAGAAVLGAGGVAASKALMYVGNELSDRLLGPRERVRIGATLALAAQEIDERIKKGESVRSDGLFTQNESGRSGAEELAESVLLKSQREPEEKKIPFMAHLLANIAFSQEISVALGEQMIKAVGQLTYRQLCVIRLAAIKDGYNLKKSSFTGEGEIPRDLYQVLHECYDLYNRGFIGNGGHAALGLLGINPSSIEPQGLGADIHNWMQLWQIPEEDLLPLVEVLGEKNSKHDNEPAK